MRPESECWKNYLKSRSGPSICSARITPRFCSAQGFSANYPGGTFQCFLWRRFEISVSLQSGKRPVDRQAQRPNELYWLVDNLDHRRAECSFVTDAQFQSAADDPVRLISACTCGPYF